MGIGGQADILHVCTYTYTYVYEHILADDTYVADIYFACTGK